MKRGGQNNILILRCWKTEMKSRIQYKSNSQGWLKKTCGNQNQLTQKPWVSNLSYSSGLKKERKKVKKKWELYINCEELLDECWEIARLIFLCTDLGLWNSIHYLSLLPQLIDKRACCTFSVERKWLSSHVQRHFNIFLPEKL